MRNKLITLLVLLPLFVVSILLGIFLYGFSQEVFLVAALILSVASLALIFWHLHRKNILIIGYNQTNTQLKVDLDSLKKKLTNEKVKSVDQESFRLFSNEDDLRRFLDKHLKNWSLVLNQNRQETENAITALTMRFKGLVDLLNNTMSASHLSLEPVLRDSEGKANTLFDQSKKTFEKDIMLIDTERQIIQQLILEFRNLKIDIDDLQDMSGDIQKISEKTKLLSLNASIEASRAAKDGHGFAVVADEINKLSENSAYSSKNMNEKMDQIKHRLSTTLKITTEADKQSELSRQAARESLSSMLSRIEKLMGTSMKLDEILQRDSGHVKKEITEMMFFMQFSDRVTQSLASLSTNMEVMSKEVKQSYLNKKVLDVVKLTETMNKNIVIPEDSIQIQGNTEDLESDITFF